MQLKTAKKEKLKLRIELSGPSGSGKTMSGLFLANGICGDWSKIALIDSEQRSSNFYVGAKAHDTVIGEFQTLELDAPYAPERYIQAIETCEKAGMEVIIIDSFSHGWEGKGGYLEIREAIAQREFRGNTWAASSKTLPRYQSLIEKILHSSAHVIVTARTKNETVQVDGRVKKIGMKQIAREGLDYDMTISFEIDRETHLAVIGKKRTHSIDFGPDAFLLTPEVGQRLFAWANSGDAPESRIISSPAPYEEVQEIIKYTKEMEWGKKKTEAFMSSYGVAGGPDTLTAEQSHNILQELYDVRAKWLVENGAKVLEESSGESALKELRAKAIESMKSAGIPKQLFDSYIGDSPTIEKYETIASNAKQTAALQKFAVESGQKFGEVVKKLGAGHPFDVDGAKLRKMIDDAASFAEPAKGEVEFEN